MNRRTVYRGGLIGLGWMGLLSDLGKRPLTHYKIDSTDRPTLALDVNRRFHFYEGPGSIQVPHSWAEVMWQRPDVELTAAAERDPKRRAIFSERYGTRNTCACAEEMLEAEDLDIVAIATNARGRAELGCLAVANGGGRWQLKSLSPTH